MFGGFQTGPFQNNYQQVPLARGGSSKRDKRRRKRIRHYSDGLELGHAIETFRGLSEEQIRAEIAVLQSKAIRSDDEEVALVLLLWMLS